MLKKTVKLSVNDFAVKANFQMYSSVVENSKPIDPVINSETLKNVVKHKQKEDRSRKCFCVWFVYSRRGRGVEL